MLSTLYLSGSAPSLDKNNRHTSHTVSRSAIIQGAIRLLADLKLASMPEGDVRKVGLV